MFELLLGFSRLGEGGFLMKKQLVTCDHCGKDVDRYVEVEARTVNSPVYQYRWHRQFCILCFGPLLERRSR